LTSLPTHAGVHDRRAAIAGSTVPIAAAVAEIALAAVWAFLAHWPNRGLQGPDDSFYLAAAHLWLSGAPPYLHVFDVKPPGLFALLALAEAIFGPSQAALDGLTTACDAATAFCLWRIGRQLGAPAVGAFAALGFPLLSQMLAENPGYPPLAAATTAAFAFATAPMSWRARVGLAGLAIGFAATIKQTAVLEGLALLWLLLREPEARAMRTTLGFAAAAAAPPLAFALVFAMQGALQPLLADAVVTASSRPGVDSEPLARTLARFFSVQSKIWPLAGVAAIAAARFRLLLPGAPAGRVEGLVLWLAASWLELLLQHARWLNYLGPTFAPALLISGAAVSTAIRDAAIRRAALLALLASTVGAAYPYRIWPFLAPGDEPAIAAAAAEIIARRPGPDDRLFAIGKGVELNVALGLAPPTPYFHWLHVLCDFPGAGPARLNEAFAAAPRFVVVASARSKPDCLDPSAWPLIERALAQSYRRISQAPAEAPRLDIYERRSAAGAPPLKP
jgi:hypothetical protein